MAPLGATSQLQALLHLLLAKLRPPIAVGGDVGLNPTSRIYIESLPLGQRGSLLSKSLTLREVRGFSQTSKKRTGMLAQLTCQSKV